MSEGDATGELLTVISRRQPILNQLREGAASKPALVAGADSSRSTVDRALRRLEALNLVGYGEDAYELTLSGRLALNAYEQFAARAESVVAAGELVSHLPADAPMSHAMLADAELVFADAGDDPGAALRERLADAGRVRALAHTYDDVLADDLLGRDTADGVDADVLLSQPGYEGAAESEALQRATEAGVVRTVETTPYGLFVCGSGGEDEACLAVYDGENSLRGVVRNDRAEAVAWAEDLISEYGEKAQRVSR